MVGLRQGYVPYSNDSIRVDPSVHYCNDCGKTGEVFMIINLWELRLYNSIAAQRLVQCFRKQRTLRTKNVEVFIITHTDLLA